MPNIGNYSAKKLMNLIDRRIAFFQNKLISGDATADNLGNHIAIKDLNMSDFDIANVGDIALDSISADDGSSFSIDNNWTAAGQTCANLGTVTTADINGGSIDGAVIGATSAAAGTFSDITVGEFIYHSGDTDTFIKFIDDTIILKAAGSSMMRADPDLGQVIINNGTIDLDFVVRSDDGSDLLHTDAANNRVGIGTDAPDYTLDVAGNIGIDEYIYHNGDADTFIRFTGDDINFRAGGVNMMDFTEGSAGAGGADHEITFNENNADLDFRVESENNPHMLFVDASTDRVGIGSATPISKLDVAGKIAITSEVSTPSAPADGKGWFYTKSDGHVYWQSNDVSEVGLSSGGATIANDADNRITTAVGDGTFNAEANLTYDGAGDLEISAGSSGDPRITFDINGTDTWTIGVDDSDGDTFKFCRGTGNVGTAVDLVIDNDKLIIPMYIEHLSDDDTYFGFSGNDTFVIHTGGSTIFKATDNYCAIGDAASPNSSYKLRITCADTSDPTTTLFIDQNNTSGGYDFYIDSERETGTGVFWDYSATTSCNMFHLYSNSSSTTSRTFLWLENDNTAATATWMMYIQQDAASTNPCIDIVTQQTTANVIEVNTDKLTTGNGIFMTADDLTTGAMLNLQSNSDDTSSRELVYILNDHASADAATVLYCRNDGAGPNGIFQGGSGLAVTANTTFPKTDTKNRLEVCHSSDDGDDGVLIYTNDTSVNAGDLLGGIGFDANDGQIPSSVTEASVGILAYAAEAFSNTDKGGELHFVTSEYDENDDTTSTERVRIDSFGNTSFAGGKNILAVKAQPLYRTSNDERVAIRVSDFKIPQHSLITKVVASVSASTDLSGDYNCTVTLGTSKATPNGTISGKIELLGAGSANTRSSTNTNAATDVDMTTTGVWANSSSFWLTGSSYYAHILNGSGNPGIATGTEGAVNIVIEWYGHGPQRN